jgi:2-oxoglutarate ferredoxin oxidoreductase subunit beta
MNIIDKKNHRSPKEYASSQDVRWCPGCGDYAILKAMQKMLADIDAPREKTVFVSGIGCSSRFPYYMDTYGFHTIHGRAPAIATGVKLANPDLDVWVVTGDGDGLSIGGNHLIHTIRRDLNLQILLFNNEIYGLTKGQYSPTSRMGTFSPSSPSGSREEPLSPTRLAFGAGGKFIARSVDTMQQHLMDVLKSAREYIGCSFVEIFQNCIVYNNDVFSEFANAKDVPSGHILVEHGQPMVFGKDREFGLRFKPGSIELEKVRIGADGIQLENIQVFDATDRTLASLVAEMRPPSMPMALGVIYVEPREEPSVKRLPERTSADTKRLRVGLEMLLKSGETWEII